MIPSGLKKQIKLYIHKGDKYICPFCNFASKDLQEIGLKIPVLTEKQVIGGGFRYGGCFKCDSSDRERLIYIYLKEILKIDTLAPSLSVLHIAPERNLTFKLINSGFKEYVCGDLFTEGYSYPAHVTELNVLNLPFKAETFDLVICNHVLEHIKDDNLALGEIYKVLKKDGKAILQVPISKNTLDTFEDFSISDPKEREKVFGQFDHIRIYGQDYPQRLEKVGFTVSRINISKEFSQYGLNQEEDLFIGIK